MDVIDLKNKIKCLHKARLQSILIELKRNSDGKVAALKQRILKLLDDVNTRDETIRVVLNTLPSPVLPSNRPTIFRKSIPHPIEDSPTYPVHPDLQFKHLPFYEELAELIKPTSLQTSLNYPKTTEFTFFLSPAQAQLIKSGRSMRYKVLVQMRIGLAETTSLQSDCYPAGLHVKVNKQSASIQAPLNGPGQDKIYLPINLTSLIHASPTKAIDIEISASPTYQRYGMALHLVREHPPESLVNMLKTRGFTVSDYTKALIIQKLKDDGGEIALTHLRVPIVCPLSKRRLQIPCRARTCDHIQCYDCNAYISMNEKKSSWICPVCDKPALFENLLICEYFQKVLASDRLPPNCTEIQLLADGNWMPIGGFNAIAGSSASVKEEAVELLNVSDDSNEECLAIKPEEAQPAIQNDTDVIDLTASDDEAPRPVARRDEPVSCKSPAVICINSDSSEVHSHHSSDSSDSSIVLPQRRRNPAARRRLRSESPSPERRHPSSVTLPTSDVTYSINKAKSSPTSIVIRKVSPNRRSRRRLRSTQSPSVENSVDKKDDPGSLVVSQSSALNEKDPKVESQVISEMILENVIDHVVTNSPRSREICELSEHQREESQSLTEPGPSCSFEDKAASQITEPATLKRSVGMRTCAKPPVTKKKGRMVSSDSDSTTDTTESDSDDCSNFSDNFSETPSDSDSDSDSDGGLVPKEGLVKEKVQQKEASTEPNNSQNTTNDSSGYYRTAVDCKSEVFESEKFTECEELRYEEPYGFDGEKFVGKEITSDFSESDDEPLVKSDTTVREETSNEKPSVLMSILNRMESSKAPPSEPPWSKMVIIPQGMLAESSDDEAPKRIVGEHLEGYITISMENNQVEKMQNSPVEFNPKLFSVGKKRPYRRRSTFQQQNEIKPNQEEVSASDETVSIAHQDPNLNEKSPRQKVNAGAGRYGPSILRRAKNPSKSLLSAFNKQNSFLKICDSSLRPISEFLSTNSLMAGWGNKVCEEPSEKPTKVSKRKPVKKPRKASITETAPSPVKEFSSQDDGKKNSQRVKASGAEGVIGNNDNSGKDKNFSTNANNFPDLSPLSRNEPLLRSFTIHRETDELASLPDEPRRKKSRKDCLRPLCELSAK